MRNMIQLGFALAFSWAGAANASDLELQRYQLENGVRVIAVHVADAPRQSTFTFLPITLANDDANRAQWSHLMEHMVIRTTDPNGSHAEGIQFNGETTATYLRFETMADAAHWKDALARHAKWLSAKSFDAANLEREKANIASEERNTAAQGYTSKFALAAWNQIVRQGVDHAAVHADVAKAKLDDLNEYASSRLRINDSITIATIGPQTLPEVRTAIVNTIGKLPAAAPLPGAQVDEIEAGQAFAGVWDVPNRHAMWFWKLPDRKPQTLAAATIISQAIQSLFYTDVDLRNMSRQAVAYPAIDVPEGPLLLIDCCLADKATGTDVGAKLMPMIAQLGEGGERHSLLGWLSPMLARQVDPNPDFAIIRQQLRPDMRDNAEGVWLLANMNFEFAWHTDAATVQKHLSDANNPALKSLLDLVIKTKPCTLSIAPATSEHTDE